MEERAREGESPVWPGPARRRRRARESSCLGVQLEGGGELHLRLNNGERPIANKYREGKMKSSPGGRCNRPETAAGEGCRGLQCARAAAEAGVRAVGGVAARGRSGFPHLWGGCEGHRGAMRWAHERAGGTRPKRRVQQEAAEYVGRPLLGARPRLVGSHVAVPTGARMGPRARRNDTAPPVLKHGPRSLPMGRVWPIEEIGDAE